MSDHSNLVRLLEAERIAYASAQCAADAILAAGWRPPAQVMAEPNALLGDQPIHACQLPAAETCPRDIPVACACGRQWMRRGLIDWRPVEDGDGL